MEKRQHLRIAMENLSVDVSDGAGFFQGMVSDISRFGMCLTDLPKRVNGDAEKITIVVSRRGIHFRMNVRPRWYTHTDGGARKSFGAEILAAPLGWTEFVMNYEPLQFLCKDASGEIRL